MILRPAYLAVYISCVEVEAEGGGTSSLFSLQMRRIARFGNGGQRRLDLLSGH